MKQRAIEYLLFSLAVGVLLGVFLGSMHVYNRIVAHNQMDAAILKILQEQQAPKPGE